MHFHVETHSLHWDSSSTVVVPLVLGIRGFQLNPDLTDRTVLARQLAWGHRYYKKATIPLGTLTSSPHVCMASVLPTERPPQPSLGFSV